MIPIGKPINNVKLYILDKNRDIFPVGFPGELCIGGVSLSNGYNNNSRLNKEKFIKTPHLPDKMIYCTGDMARWLPDGNIEFQGRIDHQVKVRGLRIELGEIETHLLTHEAIKEAVVVAKESETGSGYLCAYFVPTTSEPKSINISGLRKYLSDKLPDYMIPTYFVGLEQLPLTPSGKVDRKALPEPQIGKIADIGTYVAPRDKVEEKLAQIWSVLLEIEKEMISIDGNFFELGGHSLKVMGLAGRINKAFNIQLPISEIFSMPTIRELTAFINKTGKTLYSSIKPVEKKEYYVVSSSQKWLFVHQQNEPQNITYNITGMIRITGKVYNDKLEQAFKKIISRHKSLRTSFEIVEWEPVQEIHDEADFEIEYYESGNEESIIIDFIRSFDLSRAPLIRVGLIKLEKQAFILVVDMHHIISDGISMVILIKEFISFYEGKDLPGLPLQYRDFSEWQGHFHRSDPFRKQELYWLNRFKGDLPVLNLPTDYPRPTIQSFQGHTITFELETELSQTLIQTAKQRETTLYILLMTVFYILLFKYTRANDIVIGVPAAGRNQKELEDVVGMFVNTLAMRNTIENDCSFKAFLDKVKENGLQAYENQDYPFEELVNKLKIPRDMSRNPIFDILFVSENIGIPELKVEGLMIAPYEFKSKRSHMDLVVYIDEVGEGIKMSMEYVTVLFKPSTIEKMIQHYREILEQVTENICIKLVDITISRDSADLVSTIPREDYMNFRF
jgi:acyl carrier protein